MIFKEYLYENKLIIAGLLVLTFLSIPTALKVKEEILLAATQENSTLSATKTLNAEKTPEFTPKITVASTIEVTAQPTPEIPFDTPHPTSTHISKLVTPTKTSTYTPTFTYTVIPTGTPTKANRTLTPVTIAAFTPTTSPIPRPDILNFAPEEINLRPGEQISVTVNVDWKGYPEDYTWFAKTGLITGTKSSIITYQAPITKPLDKITLMLNYGGEVITASKDIRIEISPNLLPIEIDPNPPKPQSINKQSVKIFRWKWDEDISKYGDLSFELQFYNQQGEPVKLREELHSLPLAYSNIHIPVASAKRGDEDFFFIEFDTAWLPNDASTCDIYWRIALARRPGYLGCNAPDGYEPNEICRVTEFFEPNYQVTGIRRDDAYKYCGAPSSNGPNKKPGGGSPPPGGYP